MSKKIILLALAAASLAAFALPATAAAVETDLALHVKPTPEGAKAIDGEGTATLTGALGQTVSCPVSKGTATFTTSTTGTFEQTFGTAAQPCLNQNNEKCNSEGQVEGVITTTTLEFHLVTAVDTKTGATGPGVLVTPAVVGGVNHFATFKCGALTTPVRGNGLVGTITKLGSSTTPCTAAAASEATIEFSSSSAAVQTHKTVASEEGGVKKHTSTEYSLTAFGASASEDASGILTLGVNSTLECT